MTRRRLEEEKRRHVEGPEVSVMFRRGVTVSAVPLSLTVFRCGLNYKFVGHDPEMCRDYVGFVYEPQLRRLLREVEMSQWRGRRTGAGAGASRGEEEELQEAVKPWQHERVTALLVSLLALVEPIDAGTAELQQKEMCGTLIVEERGAAAGGDGIQRLSQRESRILSDQAQKLKLYYRNVRREQERKLSLGLS